MAALFQVNDECCFTDPLNASSPLHGKLCIVLRILEASTWQDAMIPEYDVLCIIYSTESFIVKESQLAPAPPLGVVSAGRL
ncbi:MAG: hypothetical protein A2928_03470 [Candidatus Taylorbacteria bacterium RIFCSPLOWO2_01_FULL_45_15b]|uniref:Uncharacterized protein n=1 Tax=Candidatus Taylorbacteria bacterium RIFCSPLOWO2_01_FULL_45_15b TaxID=1802319 RepID=A0A1G2NEJ1_9BACT|nr:MAG: hypothetical protein A2928_03470 [Candidatus Taylorbacteria bacterium RIFCSPLOWO2_01_FULL_45_15b]